MAIKRRDFLVASTAVSVSSFVFSGSSIGISSSVNLEAMFSKPYIDIDEWRTDPAPHRYVHGGFMGTEARFLFLFPPESQYGGRFFQYNVAIATSEHLAGNIWGGKFSEFCFESGAIAVVTNQGGFANVPQFGEDDIDPTIGAYRVSAAAAQYVRILANEMYGAHRTFGYAFGGSGGAYRTLSGAENTDAWDGVLPFIHGNLHAWPNSYAGRARVQRALKEKIPQIADALEPGGGDVYDVLNEEEKDILSEVSRLGFPMRTWMFHEAMGIGPLQVLFQGIQRLDPEYFEDFWTVPGYLGFDPPDSLTQARVQHRAKITRVIMSDMAAEIGLPSPGLSGNRQSEPDEAWRNFQANYGAPIPVAFELDALPPAEAYLAMANINIATGVSAGQWLVLGGVSGKFATFQFSPAGGSLLDITGDVKVGDEVIIDNSNILAYETYYRHALLSPDYYVGNHLRDSSGQPIYPQRPHLIALDLMKGATPSIPTGKFNCKMIIVQNLLDWDAHPWYADWYRTKVMENLGANYSDNYRLWFTDYTTHGSIPDPTRTVGFDGMLQQGLRDLAKWVEQGVEPPGETPYQVNDGQVLLPATAEDRKGLQSVVLLHVNGSDHVEVKVGEEVIFTAMAEVPPGAGAIVAAEWDFSATPEIKSGETDRFPVAEEFTPASNVAFSRSYTFDRAGTYFPALRVFSHREGNSKDNFARVPNLGRMRVVVS